MYQYWNGKTQFVIPHLDSSDFWEPSCKNRSFVIEKIIHLNESDYKKFTEDFEHIEEYPFIAENLEIMQCDILNSDDHYKCIMIPIPGDDQDGQLLFTYDHERKKVLGSFLDPDYTSYLNLRGIPVIEWKDWQTAARFTPNPQIQHDPSGTNAFSAYQMIAERAVIMSNQEYSHFLTNIQEPQILMLKYHELTYVDVEKQEVHCIFIKPLEGKAGIAVTGDVFSRIDLAAKIDDSERMRVMTEEDKVTFTEQADKQLSKQKKARTRGDVR